MNYGHPDGNQPTTTGIALPLQLINDLKWSYTLIFIYITLVTTVVPILTGLWWIQVQSKTASGLYISSAYRLFVATAHQSNLDFMEIIRILSGCHEIIDKIQWNQKKLDLKMKIFKIYQKISAKQGLNIENITVF